MKNFLVKKLKLVKYFTAIQTLWLKKAMVNLNQIKNLVEKTVQSPRIPGQCPP
ncbi:hypothetical protein Sta7437_0423 [Stanieria cyanosphaera PCC 7437]|uniref:Uncharacterized protein n=1 Tax=Stanieria cyanosphaera (strain ATCC 29371 / PCC 7437) TaxID=111780 RepID=K9XQU7_STAC7|nr:hypothetical protein Sta7437_0423 [Stanieria cyanosphaera PCC 7437]